MKVSPRIEAHCFEEKFPLAADPVYASPWLTPFTLAFEMETPSRHMLLELSTTTTNMYYVMYLLGYYLDTLTTKLHIKGEWMWSANPRCRLDHGMGDSPSQILLVLQPLTDQKLFFPSQQFCKPSVCSRTYQHPPSPLPIALSSSSSRCLFCSLLLCQLVIPPPYRFSSMSALKLRYTSFGTHM